MPLTPASGGPTNINGNRAFLGAYNVRQQDGSTVPVMAAFIEYNKNLYEIIGAMADVRRYSSTIEAALRSFNRLTDKRILSLQPDRIEIYTARQGDTIQALASRYNNPRVTADDLAILNRIPVDQPIPAGGLVKVVARGN